MPLFIDDLDPAMDAAKMEEELPLLTLANMESSKLVSGYFIKHLNAQLGPQSPTAGMKPNESFYQDFKEEIATLEECGWMDWFDSQYGCAGYRSIKTLAPDMPLDEAFVVGKAIAGEIDVNTVLYRLMCLSRSGA